MKGRTLYYPAAPDSRYQKTMNEPKDPEAAETDQTTNAVAATCAAFERAAQICRYYLKHQNFPSRWESKSEYEKGIEIACENLAKSMLEEAGKFKVEAGESLEELAANWERAGFVSVASLIRNQKNHERTPKALGSWNNQLKFNLHRFRAGFT